MNATDRLAEMNGRKLHHTINLNSMRESQDAQEAIEEAVPHLTSFPNASFDDRDPSRSFR